MKICVIIGNNWQTLSFILNFKISCLGTIHMYRLQIGFNTPSILKDFFYFVYLPLFPHYQLWMGILKIDFKDNFGAVTGESFMPHISGHGIFILSLITLWLNCCQIYQTWVFSGDIRNNCLLFYRSHTTSDMFYENIFLIWIYWIFPMLSEINYWWSYGHQ